MRRVILIVAATEIILFVATRLIVSYWSPWEWPTELLRTLFRAGAAFVFWYFFRTIIFSLVQMPEKLQHPLSIIAICLFLAVPLLVGDWHFMDPVTKSVFVATGVVVAIHEEFLFRGIVQNLFARRWGMFAAIGLTSAIATIWHLGALPLNIFNFLQVFVASCILGLIYARTQSILSVVLLHALYDAIWSLTPVLREPLPWYWGAGLMVFALYLVWLWAKREHWPNTSPQRDAPQAARP